MGGVLAWTLIVISFGNNFNGGVGMTATPMATQELCEKAGNLLQDLMSDTTKQTRFMCVRNQGTP